jgi:hypothetical protein
MLFVFRIYITGEENSLRRGAQIPDSGWSSNRYPLPSFALLVLSVFLSSSSRVSHTPSATTPEMPVINAGFDLLDEIIEDEQSQKLGEHGTFTTAFSDLHLMYHF